MCVKSVAPLICGWNSLTGVRASMLVGWDAQERLGHSLKGVGVWAGDQLREVGQLQQEEPPFSIRQTAGGRGRGVKFKDMRVQVTRGQPRGSSPPGSENPRLLGELMGKGVRGGAAVGAGGGRLAGDGGGRALMILSRTHQLAFPVTSPSGTGLFLNCRSCF